MSRHHAHHQARAGTGIAEIPCVIGLNEGAQTSAPDAPASLPMSHDPRAEGSAGFGCAQDILAFEQPLDPGLANRQQTENQGAMRYGFIAGRAHAPE